MNYDVIRPGTKDQFVLAAESRDENGASSGPGPAQSPDGAFVSLKTLLYLV